jgi:hypothetical protein
MKFIHHAGFLCTAALFTLSPSLMAWQITATDGTGTIAAFFGTGACTTIGPLASDSQCLADSFTTKTSSDNAFNIVGSVDAVNTSGKFFLLDVQNFTVTRLTAGAANVTVTIQQTFTNLSTTTNAFDSMAGSCANLGTPSGSHTVGLTSTETVNGNQVGTALNGTCVASSSASLTPGLLSTSAVNLNSSPNPVNLTESFTVAFNSASNNGTVTLSKFSLSTVPEPVSMMLIGSGLLGLAMFRRKIFRG